MSEILLMWLYCIQCRVKVERVSKNHLVNNLVEAYLKANPGELFTNVSCDIFKFKLLIIVLLLQTR